MDAMTLLVAAIGSLSACIAFLYKQSLKDKQDLQAKYDELLQFQRNDMAKMLAKYATHSQDYSRIIRSEIPMDRSEEESDTLLRTVERKSHK